MQWPEVTNQTKPWTRWWWLGAAYDTTDVRVALQQYADAGLGGLEVTDIYGVQGEEERYKEFLSPEWVDLFCYTLDEAKRRDLGIDLANASGWPFGGPWIFGDLACKTKVPRVWHVKAGERFSEKVVCHQEPMIKGYNVPDISEVQSPLYKNTQLQQWGLEQLRFEKNLPLIVLTANGPDGQVIDLISQVQPDGTLDWVAPTITNTSVGESSTQSDWILTALFLGDHGKLVERAGNGLYGNFRTGAAVGVITDVALIPFVLWHLVALGIANDDGAERHDVLWQTERRSDLLATVGYWVCAGPYGTQSHGLSGKEDILGSGRYVLHPVVGYSGQCLGFITAHDDGQRGFGCHARVRIGLRQPLKHLAVSHYDKVPGAFVYRRRSRHAGTQQFFDLILLYRPVLIGAYAGARKDVVEYNLFHTVGFLSNVLCLSGQGHRY